MAMGFDARCPVCAKIDSQLQPEGLNGDKA